MLLLLLLFVVVVAPAAAVVVVVVVVVVVDVVVVVCCCCCCLRCVPCVISTKMCSVFGGSEKKSNETIHVFSLASGHLYERYAPFREASTHTTRTHSTHTT